MAKNYFLRQSGPGLTAVLTKVATHLLFIVLVWLILSPSLVETRLKGVFLGLVAAIEFVLIIKSKSQAAHDIVFMVFLILGVWEFITTKTPNPNRMLFPPPENVFAIFYTDWKKL